MGTSIHASFVHAPIPVFGIDKYNCFSEVELYEACIFRFLVMVNDQNLLKAEENKKTEKG